MILTSLMWFKKIPNHQNYWHIPVVSNYFLCLVSYTIESVCRIRKMFFSNDDDLKLLICPGKYHVFHPPDDVEDDPLCQSKCANLYFNTTARLHKVKKLRLNTEANPFSSFKNAAETKSVSSLFNLEWYKMGAGSKDLWNLNHFSRLFRSPGSRYRTVIQTAEFTIRQKFNLLIQHFKGSKRSAVPNK